MFTILKNMNISKTFFRVKFVDYFLTNILLVICFLASPNIRAAENSVPTTFIQQNTITVAGTVIDEQGIPLAGATVIQQGTSRGTSTDFDGGFTLKVDLNSNLEISYIGYQSTIIKNVNTEMLPLSIQMAVDATSLNEIVIVGFAEQTKQTLVGAVETIKGAELQQVGSVSTISEALTVVETL